MEVELYVYDLSQGLAREFSAAFLGIQIDVVYHTAIVFGGVEYFFGAGIQTSFPGATHHGRPIEIFPLGKTDLSMEAISEHLTRLKDIFTPESYDLFFHNCNHFTQEFAIFLVGTGIPGRITSLPQTVLNSTFGQMLKLQLEHAIHGITQVPVPAIESGLSHGSTSDRNPAISSLPPTTDSLIPGGQIGVVHNVTNVDELEGLLERAKTSCAVVFFTSTTCRHSKTVYPVYAELATEFSGKVILILVKAADSREADRIAARYELSVTPTFVTFFQGEKENKWSGASERRLRANVRMLVRMAHPHPHTQLKLPQLQKPHDTAFIQDRTPSLDKLNSALGTFRNDPRIVELKEFVYARQKDSPAKTPLPSLSAVSALIVGSIQYLGPVLVFPIIHLFRLALADPRVSEYFAEEPSHETILACLQLVFSLGNKCPRMLRVDALYLTCNLFTSTRFPVQLLGNAALSSLLIPLITSSLLDTSHPLIGHAATVLAYNIGAFNRFQRLTGDGDILPESAQMELMAGVFETLRRKLWQSEDQLGLLYTVGLLAYSAPLDGELADLCRALDAMEIVRELKGINTDLDAVAEEVGMIIG